MSEYLAEAYLAEERAKILAAALPHAAFDGWSESTLDRAVADAGLDPAPDPALGRRAFPRGAVDLLEFFIADADDRMLRELEARDLPSMRMRERITTAIRVRLEQNQAHREAVRRGLTLLALPQNGPLALKTLYRTVDAIWHAAGDRATDFNFYSKRAILAGVYSATLLYWLTDDSEGAAKTWVFLDRRIAEVMRFEKAKARAAGLRDRLPDPFRILRRARRARRAN